MSSRAHRRVLRETLVGGVAGFDQLHLHVEVPEFMRQRTGKAFDGLLACGVGGRQRHRRKRRARCHVDDHAGSPGAKLRNHGLRHRQDAKSIRLEDLAQYDKGVASKAPTTSIPALLTSTSNGPAASSGRGMRSGWSRRAAARAAGLERAGHRRGGPHGGDHAPALREEWRAVSRP